MSGKDCSFRICNNPYSDHFPLCKYDLAPLSEKTRRNLRSDVFYTGYTRKCLQQYNLTYLTAVKRYLEVNSDYVYAKSMYFAF